MMKNEDNTPKSSQKKGVLRLIILVVLIIIIISNLIKPSKKETDDRPEPQNNQERVERIVEDLNIKLSDLKVVEGSPDTDRYNVSFHYDSSSWNETHFVSDMLTNYIKICSEAYQIDGINKIQMYVFIDMTDAKGNVSSEKGMSICMAKDKFKTYDWDNLKYIKGKYDLYAADCELLEIHAGIKKNVDFTQVMYE